MSALGGLDPSKCVICQCDSQEALIQMTEKGLASVMKSSTARKSHELNLRYNLKTVLRNR